MQGSLRSTLRPSKHEMALSSSPSPLVAVAVVDSKLVVLADVVVVVSSPLPPSVAVVVAVVAAVVVVLAVTVDVVPVLVAVLVAVVVVEGSASRHTKPRGPSTTVWSGGHAATHPPSNKMVLQLRHSCLAVHARQSSGHSHT